MMFRKKQKPEINAGSMADIAFLLLVFFLMVTTINQDQGILAKLPKFDEPVGKKILERNILDVSINSANEILVENKSTKISEIRLKTKDFIDNANRNNLPNLAVSPRKAIVSLKNSIGTSYEKYIQIQNELKAAYRELRNEKAKRDYGKDFEDLPIKEQKIIKQYYPQIISEAENCCQ